jgi:PTS system nitrogen regulatory IIA component
VFLLLAPEHASGDHLKALARISRLLREPDVLQRLRDASSLQDILRVLTEPATPHAA